MFGLFKKFKDGLAKTVAAIAGKTRSLFGGRKIDASSLEELEEALITADFGVETTDEILTEIKEAYRKDPELKGKQAAELGSAVLTRVLGGTTTYGTFNVSPMLMVDALEGLRPVRTVPRHFAPVHTAAVAAPVS